MEYFTFNKESDLMKDKLIVVGYVAALICYIVSLCLRTGHAQELVDLFMIIGGILLIVTSLFKIITDKKNRVK